MVVFTIIISIMIPWKRLEMPGMAQGRCPRMQCGPSWSVVLQEPRPETLRFDVEGTLGA